MVGVWRSDDNSGELAHSLHLYVSSRYWIKVTRLTWQCLYPLTRAVESLEVHLQEQRHVYALILISMQNFKNLNKPGWLDAKQPVLYFCIAKNILIYFFKKCAFYVYACVSMLMGTHIKVKGGLMDSTLPFFLRKAARGWNQAVRLSSITYLTSKPSWWPTKKESKTSKCSKNL